MAVALPQGAKRTDLLHLDADSVVVKDDLRGRAYQPTDEAVQKLAISIFQQGQIQPVEVRRVGNQYLVNAGFTRTAAVRLLNHGFVYGGVEYHDPKLKLQCVPSAHNDEEAFERNIVENAIRNNTSPIDDAINQRKLREKYGKSDKEIAELYGIDAARVSRLKKLLQLPEDQRRMVHFGELTFQAALDLLDVPEDEREAIILATAGKGKGRAAAIKKAVREAIMSDDAVTDEELAERTQLKPREKKKAAAVEEPPVKGKKAKAEPEPEAPKIKARTSKEFKDFISDCAVQTEDTDLRKLLNGLVKFFEGQLTERRMKNLIDQYDMVKVTAEAA